MWRPLAISVAVAAAVACSSTTLPMNPAPQANTREEIVAYVDRAATYVSQHGPSCQTFSNAPWFAGDWYIFVLEIDGRTVCHPARPDLVGTQEADLVDPNGKRIGQEFLAIANGPDGRGWVDYVWARPGGSVPVPKSAYVRKVIGPDGKGYIVGSGGYEVK